MEEQISKLSLEYSVANPGGSSESSQDPNSRIYKTPQRAIFSLKDLNKFLRSDTYNAFVDFILQLNASVVGVKTTAACNVSPVGLFLSFSFTSQITQF